MSNSSSQLICPSYSLSLRVNARIISARRQASLANAGSLITRQDPTCNFRRVLLASRFQARDRISDTGLSLAGNFIMHILARHQVRVLDLRSLSARALAANNSLVVRRKYAMRSERSAVAVSGAETESLHVRQLDSLPASSNCCTRARRAAERTPLIKHGIMLISRRPVPIPNPKGVVAIFPLRTARFPCGGGFPVKNERGVIPGESLRR